jgi:hypothetical protein
MNARFVALGGVVGVVLAVAVMAPRTAAQVEGGKGVFGSLNVGQMVEVRNDPQVGLIITYYDEAAFKSRMGYKIIEIERDYIALEYQDAADTVHLEMRYPLNAIAGVCHTVKNAPPKPAPAPAGTKKKKPAAD